MPPLYSRSTGALRIALTSSVGVIASAVIASAALTSGVIAIDFALRGWTPPPAEISSRVVVGPRRARQPEQPLALAQAGRRVGVRIEEDVAVVERRHQPDVPREQHAVAEHVARHVADAGDGEVRRLRVDAHFAEVALDRLPGAARGDAHRLVVVAGRAAGRERVAEPEAVFVADRVGVVGEGRRALVRGDDQIRIVRIVARTCGGGTIAVADAVVGEVEQRPRR